MSSFHRLVLARLSANEGEGYDVRSFIPASEHSLLDCKPSPLVSPNNTQTLKTFSHGVLADIYIYIGLALDYHRF